jgi:bacillithiol biosynthesis deacetylase BshB1
MKLDILAVGAHPDDVELGCGGTLALLAGQSTRVGILHLTSGEKGTRGDAERRRAEARQAAACLGAELVDFLDCGDAALRCGVEEEDALIERIRRWSPEVVLAPPPRDRHPDHGRAHQLVVDACFYAGLAGRTPEVGRETSAPDRGTRPHRPAALFFYMGHDPFEVSFIVDVTSTWETKRQALAAYGSQLHRPGGETPVAEDPPTKISSPEFAQAMEGRARHYGLLIGATFGEPFQSPLPLAITDLWAIRPRGPR